MRGSKREIKEGVWELRVSTGKDLVTGKYGQVFKRFHGDARGTDTALRDLIDEQAPRTDGVGATFSQLFDQWLEECERLDLSPTTLRTYRAEIKKTIRPRLGKVPINRLEREASRRALRVDEGQRAVRPRPSGTTMPSFRRLCTRPFAGAGQGQMSPRWQSHLESRNVSSRRRPSTSYDRSSRLPRNAIPACHRCSCLQRLPECAGESCVPSGGPTSTWTWGSSKMYAFRRYRAGRPGRERDQDRSLPSRRARPSRRGASHRAPGACQGMGRTGWRRDAAEAATPFRPDNVTSFFIRVRDSVGAPTVRLHDLRHFTATQANWRRRRCTNSGRTLGTLRSVVDAPRLQPSHPRTRPSGCGDHG